MKQETPLRFLAVLIGAATMLLVTSVLAAGASAGTCSNEEIRQEQDSTQLPDCMALELVSPQGKMGASAYSPAISADGERIVFRIRTALVETPGYQDPFNGDLYLNSRGVSGWTTVPMSAPASYDFKGITGNPLALSPEFDRWVSVQSTLAQGALGQLTAFDTTLNPDLNTNWSERSPLLTPLDRQQLASILSATKETLVEIPNGAGLYGVSSDMSHAFLYPGRLSRVAYFADDPRPSGPGPVGYSNTYVLSEGTLGELQAALLGRDDVTDVAVGGNCGAWVGGGAWNQTRGGRNQGAISADGTRVYFSTRPGQPEPLPEQRDQPQCNTDPSANPIRIMERLETPSGAQISELIESECTRVSPACDPTNGNDFFEGASIDGTKVYFTTTRQLTDSDLDTGTECDPLAGAAGCDLYLYDAAKPEGQRLTQASVGEATSSHPSVGSGAGVIKSVAAISGDGSRVYYIATGVLTEEPNPVGGLPAAGQPNLYLYEAGTGETKFIGTLDSADSDLAFLGQDISYWRNATAVPAKGDGHVFVFLSVAPITPDDTDAGKKDVFRYDSTTDGLERISTAVSGGGDNGAFNASVNSLSAIPQSEFAERARWVSEDGSRIVFSTTESLDPSDVDGNEISPYLWSADEGSSLSLLPGTGVPGINAGSQPTLSADGSEVAFLSTRRLLPMDGDTSADVYVARANGGYPNPPVPPICLGEACQGPPAPGPGQQSPATSTFVGSGNVQNDSKPAKKKPHKKKNKKNKKKKNKASKSGHKSGGAK